MAGVVASLAGTTLGRYRLVDKLGQGGMATVYRAEDPTLGRQVAVKVMHPFIAERSEAGSRFEREARAVAGLRHPNVLALHDYAPASAEHPAYLVMELLTGPSLQRFLVEHGAPLAEVAAMLGLRIAQALGAAHARGIVHRDVKPENVMFDHHRVVLCDFGIARIAAAEGVTATGAVLGSPAYMSPEQATGGEIDARSDQFSLGAVLYQLATGALPFSATSPLATMAKIVKGDHLPPTAKNPRVPQYLERVIERLLAPSPAARFPSVDAAAEALRDGLGADGFVDVDAELAAYLRDPAAYNAAAQARIVGAALAQAGRSRAAGETARALAAASRVLAWEPQNPGALEVMAGLAARPRRLAVAAVAALLLAGAVGAAAWRLRVHEVAPLPPTPASASKPPEAPRPIKSALPAATPTPVVKSPTHRRVAAPTAPVPTIAPAPTPTPTPAPSPATGPSAAAVAAAADAPATLVVAIAPWCDLSIDGQARGRTPQTLKLPPGAHQLACVNPVSGNRLTRALELAPGERRELRERLYATVKLRPHLIRGDRYAVEAGAATAAATDAEPGRRRVTLYKGGVEIETRYVDVPLFGCILVDTPRLACEKP